MTDKPIPAYCENDDIDGALFRFWCRAASYPGGWSTATMRALHDCRTLPEYRYALCKFAHAIGAAIVTDHRLDDVDGVLFRFWVRASSDLSAIGEVSSALSKCASFDQYRSALVDLARRQGINLPMPAKRTDR